MTVEVDEKLQEIRWNIALREAVDIISIAENGVYNIVYKEKKVIVKKMACILVVGRRSKNFRGYKRYTFTVKEQNGEYFNLHLALEDWGKTWVVTSPQVLLF